ncbi:hypothetical protein IscW_ISCW023234 [Ixodes scapularis]|uniref:Secreted protein n=1 Tax=Ixodes scapularis TaxID=6945 RepID=B7QJ37_IXOSC|nr:hypothetical protein IscW_ISCW023234 [Ixodes scapularis]
MGSGAWCGAATLMHMLDISWGLDLGVQGTEFSLRPPLLRCGRTGKGEENHYDFLGGIGKQTGNFAF